MKIDNINLSAQSERYCQQKVSYMETDLPGNQSSRASWQIERGSSLGRCDTGVVVDDSV